MDISTGNWFSYLRNEVLTEGLRDIGLPEFVIDYIEDAMPDASEKGRMYIANGWKQSRGSIATAITTQSLRYEVFTFLIRELGDYVIQQDNTSSMEIEPRTVSKYSLDEPEKEREVYDDEKIKQNEQVKFVIQNIRNVVGKPMGQWRKAFMKAVKALSKAGLQSEKVENIKEYLRSIYTKSFHQWINQYSELVAFLNDDPTNYELVKDMHIEEARGYADEYLQNREDPENVMHTFDDGSYWYNLDVSSCDVEAQRMGHCGSDSRGVLVSLRKKKGKRRESSSYVTMTWSQYESTLYQIKGRTNDAPPEETWDHIAWFIDNLDIERVEENGEHSSDYDGFREMIEYLASRTNASFHGSIEDRIERAEEYCQAVDDRYRDNQDELEYGSVGYSLEEEGIDDIYCFANATYEFEIDLGWPGYTETDTGAKPDEVDFKEIPTGYVGIRDFIDELGVDDMMYEMPGDDGDYDYEIKMLVGAQPNDQDFDSDTPATAHIVFSLMTNETLSVDEDGEVPEYDEFVDNMLAFEEDTAPSYREQVRQALAAGGYMAKSAYDRSREELVKLTNLDKWHVKDSQGGLEFDWTAEDGQPLHPYTGEVKFDSTRAQMYGTGTGNRMNVNPDAVFTEIYGYGPRFGVAQARFANLRGTNDYSVQFARELSKLVTAQLKSKRAPQGQTTFDFGDKYKQVDPGMFLADDTDFAIFHTVNYRPGGSRNRYPEISIKWLYRMRVNPQSPPEEFEIIQEIAAYLNENEEVVTAAANKIIGTALEEHAKKINKRKNMVMSNQEVQGLINRGMEVYGRVLDQYGDEEGYDGTAELANKMVTILRWFESNYSDMNEAERYVMVTEFLIPIAQNNFRSYSEMGQIDRNTGAPVMFGELAAKQIQAMGGQPVSMSMAARNESIEQQISRVDTLLKTAIKEEVDVRLYKVIVDATISGERAKKTKQLQDQLRGIENVTTVTTISTKQVGFNERVRYAIKFTLVGQIPRVDFVTKQLIPAMNNVEGVQIINRQGVGWSMPIEVTPGKKLAEIDSLNEYGFGGFGGVAGQLGSQRYTQGTEMPTPRPMLQRLIDDWADGGVMGYDAPANTNDMRYHTMFPIEELLPFISDKTYRGDMKDFEGRYRYFVKSGPRAPVYLAIGKVNRTAKITGGEDLIWFAKKAGLKELPVFISYQRQV